MDNGRIALPQWSTKRSSNFHGQVVSSKNIWIRSVQLAEQLVRESKATRDKRRQGRDKARCELCRKILPDKGKTQDVRLPPINTGKPSEGIFHVNDALNRQKLDRKKKSKTKGGSKPSKSMRASKSSEERDYCPCSTIRCKMKTCRNSFLREDRDSEVLKFCRLPMDEDEDIYRRQLGRFSANREDKYLTYTYLLQQSKETHISLANHGLSDFWGQILSDTVLHSLTIRSLDLKGNSLGEHGVKLLSKGLESNRTIEVVDLSANNLGDSFALASLARVVDINETLKEISLASNDLTDLDIEPLISACTNNSSLLRLNLRANRLGPLSSEYLKQLLVDNNTLEELDVGCNNIGPSGVRKLFEGLAANTSLRKLILTTNGIGESGMEEVKNVTALGSDLAFLDLSNNLLTDHALITFSRFFKASNALQGLRLDENPFTSTGLLSLLKSVLGSANVLLTHLSVGNVFLDKQVRTLLEKVRGRNKKFELYGGYGISRDSSTAFRVLDRYMVKHPFLLANPTEPEQCDDESPPQDKAQ